MSMAIRHHPTWWKYDREVIVKETVVLMETFLLCQFYRNMTVYMHRSDPSQGFAEGEVYLTSSTFGFASQSRSWGTREYPINHPSHRKFQHSPTIPLMPILSSILTTTCEAGIIMPRPQMKSGSPERKDFWPGSHRQQAIQPSSRVPPKAQCLHKACAVSFTARSF